MSLSIAGCRSIVCAIGALVRKETLNFLEHTTHRYDFNISDAVFIVDPAKGIKWIVPSFKQDMIFGSRLLEQIFYFSPLRLGRNCRID